MMDFIQQKYHGTAPEEYGYPWKIGQPVVAYYPDDDKFYRAKIVSEDSRGYEVNLRTLIMLWIFLCCDNDHNRNLS